MRSNEEIIAFIRKTFNQPTGFIPLHAPLFIGNEKKYLEECIDSTFVSSVGKFVDLFEVKIAEYTGSKKAVACVNGTNALYLALKLAGAIQNDEVLTQPLTFVATANAISYCGAHPVFLDVDIDTMGLSPKALLNFLETNTAFNPSTNQLINSSTNRPVTACVPMHTFGHPCRIDEIVEICTHFHIPVIEDAAESIGSTYKGKHTGTFGKIGILSFNGNKIITTGGGGMLLFNDEELADKAKHLTTQAKLPHPWNFVHDEIGYNYRMPNINAAIGLAQLEKAEILRQGRQRCAEYYYRELSELNTIDLPVCYGPVENHSWHIFPIVIRPEARLSRDEFIEKISNKGIGVSVHYKPIHRMTYYKQAYNLDPQNYPNAERIWKGTVSLPIYPDLTEDGLKYVCETVKSLMNNRQNYFLPGEAKSGKSVNNNLLTNNTFELPNVKKITLL